VVEEWRAGDAAADRKVAERPQSAYHASFKALKDSLTEFTDHGKQRIVVFIDDLDRCLPANALQVLESMKLFFDLPGFVFVVGLDQKVIEASINWNYRLSESSETGAAGLPINGADYIKKLFQVPFNLPSVSSVQIDDYLEAVLSGGEERDAEQEKLLGRVRPHLDALVGDSEVNPREIKRYINSYILQKLIRKNPDGGKPDDDEVTLLLQTIVFRPDWSAAYEVFRSRPEAFTDALKRQLDGEDSALKDLDPRLGQLPEPFFQYINSKGGRRLASLDPPQLAEQISTFEVTRTPEDPLYSLLQALSSVRIELDKIDPLDLSGSTTAAETFRRAIREIDNELASEYSRLQISGPRSAREETAIDKLREVMSSLKDDSDRLVFALRRGDDMGAEEFDEALNRRTRVTERVREARQWLEEIIRMR
jgi:KAP-like P-loop domain-containing protein